MFAPTDSAFEEIGLNLSDYDTDEENDTLSKILSYHVAMGSIMANDLEDGTEINSLIQDPISVNIYGQGAVVLNGEASVTSADVQTSNGIIHVIDKVLMPPSESPDTPSEGEICYDMGTHTVDLTKTEETCDKMWVSAVDIPTTAAAKPEGARIEPSASYRSAIALQNVSDVGVPNLPYWNFTFLVLWDLEFGYNIVEAW